MQQNHWIVDFVSCGAKNYAYKLNTGEVVCKVCRFSLNYSALRIVNLDSMKDAVISWKNKIVKPEMVTIKTMILQDKLKVMVLFITNVSLWMIILLLPMDLKKIYNTI